MSRSLALRGFDSGPWPAKRRLLEAAATTSQRGSVQQLHVLVEIQGLHYHDPRFRRNLSRMIQWGITSARSDDTGRVRSLAAIMRRKLGAILPDNRPLKDDRWVDAVEVEQ